MTDFAPADVTDGSPFASPAAEREQRRPGVLVVDDEEGIRKLLARALPCHGFAVWVVPDGREAIGVYEEHRARIDLALLDVQMAECDGPQTLVARREIAPDVRACFMTGDPGPHTVQSLLALGAVAVLEKPFGLAGLAASLKPLLPSEAPPGA